MLFDFERDFAGSLRCIPMVARQKLDIVGIKLSLRQWSRFTHEAQHSYEANLNTMQITRSMMTRTINLMK